MSGSKFQIFSAALISDALKHMHVDILQNFEFLSVIFLGVGRVRPTNLLFNYNKKVSVCVSSNWCT